MGIVRTAARKIVHAPIDILGFDFDNLERKQLGDHITHLLDHGTASTVTGQLITIAGEGTSVECGRQGNVFSLQPSKCKWVDHSWMWNTITALEQSDIKIENDLLELSMWRESDYFLMDQIALLNTFSDSEMKDINVVRLYLKVCNLSDITTVDGLTIQQDMMEGRPGHSISEKAYGCPRIPKSLMACIRTWQQALRLAYTTVQGLHV